MSRLLVALLLLAAAPLARAESGRWGSFELRLSTYRPNIDADPAGGTYTDIFGDGRPLMYRALVSKSVLVHAAGTLDVGIGGGYFEDYGRGLDPTTGAQTRDTTSIRIFPVSLAVTYRLEWIAQRYWYLPFVPYVRASFERYWWQIRDSSGNTAEFNGDDGKGATNGYSFTAGLALLLDAFDGQLAREADLDNGVNETYLYIDFAHTEVDDFGSKSSFDLSDERFTPSIGLMFVF